MNSRGTEESSVRRSTKIGFILFILSSDMILSLVLKVFCFHKHK